MTVERSSNGEQDQARGGPQETVVLALDAEGGDRGPAEILAGAAAVANPRLRVLAVGRPGVLEPLLAESQNPYLQLLPSGSVISSYDEPAAAVRSKSDSSIAVGARAVAEGQAQGFVSAGSTGAMLAAGLLVVKRVKGIQRPAIVTLLPGMEGPVVFLDAGANADCRPEQLLEFGILGSLFAARFLGKERPTVALLNIGEEETKGSELALAAHKLLVASDLAFVGNIEGRDILFNKADVVVTDGFTGNVALKLLEGTARSLLMRVKQAAESGTRAKLGGLLLRPSLSSMRRDLDPEEYGGTYLLGLRGLLVICHGNSTRYAIANALRFGENAVRGKVVEAIAHEVERIARMD